MKNKSFDHFDTNQTCEEISGFVPSPSELAESVESANAIASDILANQADIDLTIGAF